MTERTFVMAKPDAVQRGLVGEIVSRLEDRGLKLVGAKFMRIDRDLALPVTDPPRFWGRDPAARSGFSEIPTWEPSTSHRRRVSS